MRQSRLMSLVEAVANVIIGLLVAVATQTSCSRSLGCTRPSGRTSSWRSTSRRIHRAQLRVASDVRSNRGQGQMMLPPPVSWGLGHGQCGRCGT